MNNLLSYAFWFDATPVRLSPLFERGFFLLFALLLIGSVVARIIAKNNKEKRTVQLAKRASGAMMWMSLWGFFWLFASFEEVQLFGMRFWAVLWAVVAAIIVTTIVITDRRERAHLAQRKSEGGNKFNAYIPRAKWRR